jgi:hypothetical protein
MKGHTGKSLALLFLVAVAISFLPTLTSAQVVPNSIEGFITCDGEGVEGIKVKAYNQDTGQRTEAQEKTDNRGYYDIWASSNFMINPGDTIQIYFTYDGEEYLDYVNAEEGVTQLDFEVDEPGSSMGTFFILVSLFIISGIIFFLWKKEVIQVGR